VRRLGLPPYDAEVSFLSTAVREARARVDDAAQAVPLPALRARAGERQPPSFATALSGAGVAVIAEIKRASPSRGDLAVLPDPAETARRYAAGGAHAVSVLTEPRHFRGSLEDLTAAADAVAVPVLRKDFVVDAYQVWEAAGAGAAAVLLIVAALDDAALTALLAAVAEAGLDALVEVHDVAEAQRAVAAHAAAATGRRLVVGVNARDLATLDVDPERFGAVRGSVPADALVVAESGVAGPDDVTRLGHLGADAVLVGEHVVTAPDPEGAVRALVHGGARR
jgi:indole-3-glycerol phosphate synthase